MCKPSYSHPFLTRLPHQQLVDVWPGSCFRPNMPKILTLSSSPSFFSELKELEKNLTAVHDRILVSDRVNILLDLHIAVDGLEEEELGG